MLLTVVIALSARILNANACSVVHLLCWYTACDVGVLCLILSPTLFMRHIANIFLMADNRIRGLRFAHGPFFLPSFSSGDPRLSSIGVSLFGVVILD